jgi:RNA polymerase sigma-70 factor (ECF subfamily)
VDRKVRGPCRVFLSAKTGAAKRPRRPERAADRCRNGLRFDFFRLGGVSWIGGTGILIFREIEDRDLILRGRRGDVDAYNILVSRWEKRVYNYLLQTLRDREDALDLCQETFLKAYRALGRLEEVDRFPQWIFRIARNEAVSLYRRNRFRAEDEDVEAASDLAAAAVPSGRLELSLAVQAALERLKPEQREVVVLKVYQGFKFHEIAEILDSPVSTIKSRLYSALEALKVTLAPVG